MADEVIISNVGGQDGVASEATLQALVRAIERMGGQRGQRGAGSKVQDMYNKAQQAGTVATTNQTGAVKENTGEVKKSSRAVADLTRGFGALAMRGVGQVMAGLVGMGKALLDGQDSMQAYASQIPIVGSLLGAMAGYLDRSVDTFRELSSVGAGFNNDILAMRRAAAQNGLTLEEFSSLIRNNTDTFAKFGGTVTQGVQRFTAMNTALKETGTFEQLKGMGFSITEINEGMANYIELQGRLGRLEGKSTQELAAGSAAYLKELDMLSKLTGKSRKELAEADARRASDSAFRALTNQFEEGSEQAKNLAASMALIETLPADLQTALKDLADGVANTDLGKQLTAQVPEVRDAMMQVARGADPKILQDALARAGETLEQRFVGQGGASAATLQALAEANPALKSIIDSAIEMRRLRERSLDDARRESNTTNDTTTSLTTFQDSVRGLSGAIQTLFIESGLLELFAKGISATTDLIKGMTGTIKEFTEKVKVDGFLPAILGLVGDAIKGIFTNGTVIAAMVAGIGALFLAKAVVGALGRGLSGVADNVASRMMGGFGARAAPTAGATIAGSAAASAGGAGAAGAAGSAAASAGQALKSVGDGIQKLLAGIAKGFAEFGKTVGEIGKGIGTGLGGILEGLAKGLTAFANPAILMGAGILSGAIVAIGAGIAGATWIMGKALPTFAEGLNAFSDIDGNNLVRVGAGIGAIGVALAGMAVGSVMGAIGGVLTNLIDALPGKSLLDRLKEFSSMDLNAEKSKANAEAIVAYSNAMSALGDTGSLGRLVTNAVDGLIGFFGGEVKIPYAKMVEFQSYNFDPTKMQQNGLAVKAFAEAMSNIPTVSGERTGGLIGAVANFFMGSAQVPWAQAVAFGQLTLPVDKIKTNAEAMAAFGEALSKVPQINATRSGGLLEGLRSFFSGSQQMPWDSMRQFGELRIDAPRIKANAEALAAFGNALDAFKGGGQGTANISIPPDSVTSLGRLATIGSAGGLQQAAMGLQAIAGVQNLQTTLTALNGLDAAKLTTYNTALRDLTRALSDLNKELSNENRGGLFGMGESRANAGEVLRNISVNTSAGAGNTEQLNGTMMRMIEILQQMKEISDKIEKNTKRGTGVDVANRDVTSF